MESLYKGTCKPIIVTAEDGTRLNIGPLAEFIAGWNIKSTWLQLDEIIYIFTHHYAISLATIDGEEIKNIQELLFLLREIRNAIFEADRF